MRPLLLATAMLAAALPARGELIEFSAEELRGIQSHGPWPLPWSRDGSNRVSGNAEAIALGRRLFFDARLSANGKVSCASCHDPARDWSDGRLRAVGLAGVDRNTPALWNVRLQRWFGWGGANDSLWAQSLRPILDGREMGLTLERFAQFFRADPDYACGYRRAFGTAPAADDEALIADTGKALAAFQETLVTGRTPFDEFRDALARGDRAAAARYPAAAQRGLRLFVGRGRCNLCHFGPLFTNGEFADIGIPYFIARGQVDSGRHAGIRALQENRFNQLGPYNDAPAQAAGESTRYVAAQQRNFGEFRVPGLRNVARTAPYMHNGSLADLAAVLRHYSELDENRLHADGEQILKPLRLTPQESGDLTAFLESLSAAVDESLLRRPNAARCAP